MGQCRPERLGTMVVTPTVGVYTGWTVHLRLWGIRFGAALTAEQPQLLLGCSWACEGWTGPQRSHPSPPHPSAPLVDLAS